MPASRIRVGKYGSYHSPRYKQFRDAAYDHIVDLHLGAERLQGPLHVEVTFVGKRPKKTTQHGPRADIDNYMKAIFDSCNGVVWEDDRQIVSVYAEKIWSEPGEEGCIIMSVERKENDS